MYVFYDFEVVKNCFLACFKDRETGKRHKFLVNKFSNDLVKFVEFVRQCKGQIGYNCVRYDAQIQQWILNYVDYLSQFSGRQIAEEISQYSDRVIELSNSKQFLDFPEWKLDVPQCDIMLIHHFNNDAKRTALKWLQFGMDWPDVREMDIDWKVGVKSDEELIQLEKYCWNDVDSTEEAYKITKGITELEEYKGKDKIELRKYLNELINENTSNPKYHKSCINWNDVKIGDYLNLQAYCKVTGDTKDKILARKHEHARAFVYLKDCVPTYTKFKTKLLQDLFEEIKNTAIEVKNPNFNKQITIGNTTHNIALGGIHSEDKPRRVILEPNQIMRDADVGGQYPASIVRRRLYPSHLSESWCDQVEVRIRKRNQLKPLAKKDKKAKAHVEYYKLANNGGTFGKVGEITSWQYDPKVLWSITVGCQMDILMLIEDLELNNINVISSNTDGVVSVFDKSQEELYHKICKEWEVNTNSTDLGQLEFTDYKELVQMSVNDYIAIKTTGETKKKGDFLTDFELHKNKSRRIVPLTLEAYYKDKVDIETYVKSHKNIYNFCCAVRADKSMTLQVLDSHTGEFEQQQKTVRYYVANTKKVLVKRMKKLANKRAKMQFDIFGGIDNGTRQNQVEAGYNIIVFNKFEQKDDYNINYNYYINKIMEKVNKLQDTKVISKAIV